MHRGLARCLHLYSVVFLLLPFLLMHTMQSLRPRSVSQSAICRVNGSMTLICGLYSSSEQQIIGKLSAGLPKSVIGYSCIFMKISICFVVFLRRISGGSLQRKLLASTVFVFNVLVSPCCNVNSVDLMHDSCGRRRPWKHHEPQLQADRLQRHSRCPVQRPPRPDEPLASSRSCEVLVSSLVLITIS